jgi:hypothetical protein
MTEFCVLVAAIVVGIRRVPGVEIRDPKVIAMIALVFDLRRRQKESAERQ